MTRQTRDEAPRGSESAPTVNAPPSPLGVSAIAALASLRVTDDPTEPWAPRPSLAPCVPDAYRAGPRGLRVRMAGPIWAAVASLPASDRAGVLLLGPTGCGKSAGAAFLVQRWRHKQAVASERAPTVHWLDALDATDAERRYKLGTGDPDYLTEAVRADWTVIDDVGTSTSATVVQLVLSRRYQLGRPSIVTTGLTTAQLAEHLGAATVRRIVEWRGRPGLLVDCHPRAVVKGGRL